MKTGQKIALSYLADPKKGLMLGASLVALALLAWAIVAKIKRARADRQQRDPAAGLDNLTFGAAQYVTLAGQLETAMNYPGVSQTDEQAIYKVFAKLKTLDDVTALERAFGVREWKNLINGFGLGSHSGTLADWLGWELDNSELSELNNTLAKSNINYSY